MQIVQKHISNQDKVLNLFAYTGGATIACAQNGAEVLHLDSSKKAVEQRNLELYISG